MIRGRYLKRFILLVCLALLLCMVFMLLRKPSGMLLSPVSRSPVGFLIHYSWNISDSQDDMVDADLKVENHSFVLYIFGQRNMCSMEFGTAWHTLKNDSFGWYFDLEKVIIGEGVVDIGENAFQDCIELSEAVLPESVACIGENSFAGCSSLYEISYGGTVDEWEKIDLSDGWMRDSAIVKIECSDGTVIL